jgi:hypothetical protein
MGRGGRVSGTVSEQALPLDRQIGGDPPTAGRTIDLDS